MNQKGRIYFFDNLKVFLICCVVLGHLSELIWKNFEFNKYLTLFIYSFHMPAFIFVTGYFSKSLVTKNEFKIKKISYLILTYIVFQALLFFLYVLLTGEIKNIIHIVGSQFSFFDPRYTLWYLLVTIIYYISLPLIQRFDGKKVVAVSIVLGILIGWDKNAEHMLSLGRLFTFAPFFYTGYYLTENQIMRLKRASRKIKVCFSITAVLIVLTCVINGYITKEMLAGRWAYNTMGISKVDGSIQRMLMYFLAFISIIVLIILIPNKKKFFSSIGGKTLQVYVLHAFILHAIQLLNSSAYFIEKAPFYQYLIIPLSVAMVGILSLKIFSYPFIWLQNLNQKLFLFFESKFKLPVNIVTGIKKKKRPIEYMYMCISIIVIVLLAFFLIKKIQVSLVIHQYKKTIKEEKYMKHALGGINKNSYTNSMEALEENYKNGSRLFEVDVNFTSDKRLVLTHGWNEYDYKNKLGVEYSEEVPTYKEFMSYKIQGEYSANSFSELIEFMQQHQDMFIMVDIANQPYNETLEIYQAIVKEAKNDSRILMRMIAGGQTTTMIEAVREAYDFPLMNLYLDKESKRKELVEIAEFEEYCRNNKISSLSTNLNVFNEEVKIHIKNKELIVYVFTVNDEKVAKEILKNGADVVGTDFLEE